MEKLTRDQVVDQFRDKYGMDISNGLRFRVVDNVNNSLAPERFSYKISYVCELTGKRERLTYWPNSLGYQE